MINFLAGFKTYLGIALAVVGGLAPWTLRRPRTFRTGLTRLWWPLAAS